MSASDSDTDAVVIDRDDVSNYNPEQILPESPEIIDKIRHWLQPTSYDIAGGEYRKHLASYVPGTGAWLTSSAAYQEWLQGAENGLLWIKGIPGSGKSVMAAKLIDEIAKTNPGCPVLFFFFRQIIEANHEPSALLRDWMDQVLAYSPPLQRQLKTYVESRRSIGSLSMEDLWKDLRMAFAGLPDKVFCVADALDEMDQGHDTFLKALGALGQWRPGTVKVLMTSRPVPAVEGPLRTTPCVHLRLQEGLVDADISTYVQFALSRSAIPRSDWQVVANAVPGRANGLFLYAKLAMDAFLEPGADVSAVLSQLPADLNVLYTDLLKEHAQRSGVAADIQLLILQAVTHAARPLRLLELAEMIKVVSPDGFTRDLKATKSLIKAACGPLLEILADETVSVIHHSFTEYLKGTTRSDDGSGYPILQMGTVHTRLALACLRYLRAGCLDAVEIKINDDEEVDHDATNHSYMNSDSVLPMEVQIRLKNPFFEYAASNWHHHINISEAAGNDQTEVTAELSGFIGHTQTMKAWLELRWPGGHKKAGRVTQVHIAAKTGLVSYIKKLIATMDVDSCDSCGKTPLWWAATEGHSIVVSALIANGANPDRDEDGSGLKPLHEAAKRNHHEVAKALLGAGVDPLTPKTREYPGRRCGNSPGTTGQTPLMYACQNGHLETVEVFLPFLGDIDTVHQALAWAAKRGQTKVVARILEHPGVDVDSIVRGDTALLLACGGSHSATIKVLLDAGADPTAGCGSDGIGTVVSVFGQERSSFPKKTCLERLCSSNANSSDRVDADGLREIFSLLVHAGVDVHQRTRSGGTALHSAVVSPILTRLLLDAGVDANATDQTGATALHKVENVDSMVLLIELGHADINIALEDGRTPLLCLLSTFKKDAILKLLEYGPDCSVSDNKGNGALHISLNQWSSNPEIIKALLDGGADPNLRNRDGVPPLFLLNRGDREPEIVDVLIKAGADINARDRKGKALLFRSLANTSYGSGEEACKDIRGLIDRGASPAVCDFAGRSILHEAVITHGLHMHTHATPKLDYLVSLGLDIHAVDYGGNGLLHEIALRIDNHESYSGPKILLLWKQLVASGLNLEQKNHAGRTPLHILCATSTTSSRFEQGVIMPIDFVISQTTQIDIADNDGITPLHIAVTGGELYAKKLLDAGADPAMATHEGLTPLHLASRCRESNIVGLLLDALRRCQETSVVANAPQSGDFENLCKGQTKSSPGPVVGVDAKAFNQKVEFTPLFYACRSGRPETVALLLEAGADIKSGRVFQACTGFEQEDSLWADRRQPIGNGANGHGVALKVSDTWRQYPWTGFPGAIHSDKLDANETARLGEVLDLLVQYGADLSPAAFGAHGPIYMAEGGNADYAVACLRDAQDRIAIDSANKVEKGAPASLWEQMHRSVRKASIQTMKDCGSIKPGDSNQDLLRRLLARREHHLVEQLAPLGVSFLPTPGKDAVSNLAVLIRHGFTSLVEKIGTYEAESQAGKGAWHAYGDESRPGLWFASRDISMPNLRGHNPVPFLIDAVRRELPNLDVVRLLVEKFCVHIDELEYTNTYVNDTYATVPTDSALHYAARGNCWWHAHQALPYLIKAGADIDIRDHNGQTPLHMALQGDGNYPGPFSRDAAKILIEAGADVNAVDDSGRSCLACAQHDIDTIKLLISHGATVTAEALFAAIDVKNVEILRVLLSGGTDANIRRDRAPEESATTKSHARPSSIRTADTLEPHEVFPIYHAASALRVGSKPTPKDIWQLEAGTQLVQALLDHGADPYAKFLIRQPQLPVRTLKDVETDTPSTKMPEGYEECTTIHELLMAGAVPDNFLRLPNLDINCRDARGRTLLHAACNSADGPDYVLGSHKGSVSEKEPVSLFQRLISLGADLQARDNFGRNVLHHMLDGEPRGHGNGFNLFKESLAAVLSQAPALANQADGAGKTPLHYAVLRVTKRRETEVAELILAAGADPLAVDNDGDGVLHILTRNLGLPALHVFFRDIVRRGVDLNGRNAKGETPLFAFSRRPRQNKQFSNFFTQFNEQEKETPEQVALSMLKELGADFFARDNRGQGLLHVAAHGDVQRFKDLKALGLDAMLEDDAQQTAIDVAAACGNQEILELFEKKDYE